MFAGILLLFSAFSLYTTVVQARDSQATFVSHILQLRGNAYGISPCKIMCLASVFRHTRSSYLPTRTDKNRQEPSRGNIRLKYYLLDPIHTLYIKISHIIDFASPQNNVIAILYIPLLTDKKFFVM